MINNKNFNTSTLIDTFRSSNLSILLITWVIFISVPFDIAVVNPEDLAFTPGISILFNGLKYSLFLFLVLNILTFCIILFFNDRLQKIFLNFLTFSAIHVWIHTTFLVGIYGFFDGRRNFKIDIFSYLSWIQIGVIITIIMLVIYLDKSPKIKEYIVGSLLLIAILTGTINIVVKLNQKVPDFLPKEDTFKYSRNNPNVLYVIFDELEKDNFAHILSDNLELELNSFIWYKDSVANFSATEFALPAMLSGEVNKNLSDNNEYYTIASKKSIAKKIAQEGGLVSYDPPTSRFDFLFPNRSLIDFSDVNKRYSENYIDLAYISLFRAIPDILKLQFIRGRGWVTKALSLIETDPYVRLGNSSQSFKKLRYLSSQNVIAVDDYPTTFKFYHSLTTHVPIVLNENCELIGEVEPTLENKNAEATCAIKHFLYIVKNLKRVGVFDNTMIILASDHGTHIESNRLPSVLPYSKASTMLLIKPLFRNAEFQVSNYPVQPSDIPKTIAEELNIPQDYPGLNLLGPLTPKKRIREFSKIVWEKGGKTVTKFSVEGAIDNSKSWRKVDNYLPIIECTTTLKFFDENQILYYGELGLGIQENWGRQAKSSLVDISFRMQDKCDPKQLKLKLNALTTPENPEYSAKVSVNNQPIGQVKITLEEEQPKEFIFDLPRLESNELMLRFEVDNLVPLKPVNFNKNEGKLGLGFIEMDIISESN